MKVRNGRKLGLVNVLVMVLLLASVGTLPAVGPTPNWEADWSVVDPYLFELLETAPTDKELQVIVQFEDVVEDQDREVLISEGLAFLHEFHIVPAILARATPWEIERMATYGRTRWIEFDEPLVTMMDETTVVVNATDSWRSVVEGSLWGTQGIDGRGVTAVVLDTGIDAGHPDLDYGTKTIRNLKSDTGTGPWYEIENGDTSSGHGTHCAGTVAGNGDASGGSRRGMAPGANLIGLSVGEAAVISGAVGGLEWVYDNSQPGNNPYNIRVVSNSWGAGGGQYNPGDSISEAINKLTYDNNVAVVFAAGNSGGTGDDIRSSNYGNTPAAICVAASGRNGTYITSFSSKGRWDWVDTWPDITAPGHYIESTAARRTQISAMTQQGDSDPYYLAISGTSMATPHVSGLMALLFQAAPSLRTSEVRQHAGLVAVEDGNYLVTSPEEGTYGDLAYPVDVWLSEAPDTRIHEAEAIIKLTADYIPPGDNPDPDMNNQTSNFVPDWWVPGIGERPHDFSQGYGLINAHRAVGLALTLERIRWDYEEATVLDAYEVFEDIFAEREVADDTDILTASWSGEWSRFNEQPTHPGVVFASEQNKWLYVPDGADEVTATIAFSPFDTTKLIAGTLGFKVDFNDDGTWDWQSPVTPVLDGIRTERIPVSGNGGDYWRIGVEGHGFRWHRLIAQKQFQEARIEYDLSVSIHFPSGYGTIMVPELDHHAAFANLRFGPPSDTYTDGNISLHRQVYNITNIQWSPYVEPPYYPESEGPSLWWLLVAIVVLAFLALLVAKLWPESRPGRLVRRVATATGIATVYGYVEGGARRVLRLTKKEEPIEAIATAEIVPEEHTPGDV